MLYLLVFGNIDMSCEDDKPNPIVTIPSSQSYDWGFESKYGWDFPMFNQIYTIVSLPIYTIRLIHNTSKYTY